MARPKKMSEEINAKERIINAFWELLSKESYNSITIAKLADEAKVNHNTIYRYFKNIDDLAIHAFNEENIPNLPHILMEAYHQHTFEPELLAKNQEILEIWTKGSLFYNSGSQFLLDYCRKIMLTFWMQELGVSENDLTLDQQADLNFIFSGLIAQSQLSFIKKDPMFMLGLLKRPLGMAILETLSNLSKNRD